MKQHIPNSKLLCCASVFAFSLAACSNQPKVNNADLADNEAHGTTNHIVKLKKGHRSKRLGLEFPDPRSYDNLWDRLFDRFDLPEVSHQDVDRELNWFINHPAYIERVQSRAEPFLYSIVKQLEKHNMPGELALLPVIESAFQPHVVSPAHAAGIWQFIPATGRHYGLKQSHSYDGRRDIYASTRAAIKYLKKLHNDFNGDWLLAVAGYNCGEGAVARAIQRNNARGLPTDFWSLDLPQETRTYVPRLLAVAKLFSESEQYGFSLRPIPNKALYKTVKMNNQVDLALAANAADISLERLFELNPGFKRQHVDLDGSYRLFIPAHKKIVDFKEDLARQMAAEHAYASQDGALPELANLKSTANEIIETQAPATTEKPTPIKTATTEHQERTPEPAEISQAEEPLVQPSEPAEISQAEEPLVQPSEPTEISQAEEPLVQPSEPTVISQVSEPVAHIPKQAPSPQTAELGAQTQDVARMPETQASEAVESFVQSEMPKSTPDLGGENFVSASIDESSALESVTANEPQETSEAVWTRRKSRQRQQTPPPSTEPAFKAAEYERVVAASEKGRLAQKPLLASQKGQEGVSKATDRKFPPPSVYDHTVSIKGRNKDALKEYDRPVYERRVSEPDNPGKQAVYRVQEGDTLYSIARKHGMDVDELKKMNRLSQADSINYGRTLMVPGNESGKNLPAKAGGAAKPSQSTKYTAHDGETLFSISRRFNVTVADLRKWNGIKEDKQFRAGMNITVSGEKD